MSNLDKRVKIFFVVTYFYKGDAVLYANGEGDLDKKPCGIKDIEEVEALCLADIKTKVDTPIDKCIMTFWRLF